jgi:RHS repeat-associated protein
LGNTLFLTGDTGTVTDKYSYDAWGSVLSHTGSTQQPYQLGGRFGYYTHYQDAGLAPLVQVGIRLYDPSMGRFLQPDIYARDDGASAYAYVGDEPTSNVDPSGKFWCKLVPHFPFIECHLGPRPKPPSPPAAPTPGPNPCPGPGSGPPPGNPNDPCSFHVGASCQECLDYLREKCDQEHPFNADPCTKRQTICTAACDDNPHDAGTAKDCWNGKGMVGDY